MMIAFRTQFMRRGMHRPLAIPVYACLAAVLAALPCPASANLTAAGIAVLDVTNAARNSYSNTEYVVLRQQVRNETASSNMISFKFYIKNPSGATVFTHTGNAAPGTPGLAQTQLSGMNISRFYSVPGDYVFRGEATLDAETVTQEIKFAVSSPNITLIYPPLGARALADTPLIFRWSASGASRYRLTVSDSASLYNPVHTAMNSGESSYSYPANPTQPREQLSPGQVYYWKVEGLDAYNNVISNSNIYNFSMQAQGTKTRDVAVTTLEMPNPGALDFTKQVEFKVIIKNLGDSSENNINVKLTIGGMPADGSPKSVPTLDAGQSHTLPFNGYVPQDQNQSLVVACIDLFDDNIPNNCKTLLLTKPSAQVTGPAQDYKNMTYDQMLEALKKRLGPDIMKQLEGYDLSSLTCTNCAGNELNSIISALLSGAATITNASVTEDTPISVQTGGGGAMETDTGAEEKPDMDIDFSGAGDGGQPKDYTEKEMWDILKKRLDAATLKSLEGYDIGSMFCSNCTKGELNSLFAALESGEASISGASVTGASIAVQPHGADGKAEDDSEEPAEMDDPELAPMQTSPDEWTGYTNAFNNDEIINFAVKTKDDWKKLWGIISNESAPSVNFKDKMVIGIVAGGDNRADTIRLLSQRPGEEGLKVDYYLIKAEESRELPFSPYIFKVVDKVEGKVEYKRLDVDK